MIRQAVAEMEGPEEDTNDGATNHSIEATASVEPMAHNHPPEIPTPAQSLPAVGASRLTQSASFSQPLITPTSQFTAITPQQSPDQDMKEEQSTDQSIKLDKPKVSFPDLPVRNEISLRTTGIRDARTAISSDLSDLDST